MAAKSTKPATGESLEEKVAVAKAEAIDPTIGEDDFILESHSAAQFDAQAGTTDVVSQEGGESAGTFDDAFDLPARVDTSVEELPPAAAKATSTEPARRPEATAGRDPGKAAGATEPAKATKRREFKRGSFDARIAERQAELDRITRELRDAERRMATIRGTTESGGRAAADPGTGKVPDKATADPVTTTEAMPKHPQYRDFDTDEAYEAAVAKWQTEDVPAWQQRRDETLRTSLAESVETRLTREREEREQGVQLQAAATVMKALRDKDPDAYDQRKETLQTLASAWYDEGQHGENQTPFITHLSSTLLQQGNAEGGELLYWLGDPDQQDRAQAVADLIPTRPLRDALVAAPRLIPLLEYFATDEGAKHWNELRRHRDAARVSLEIGALSTRLVAAEDSSGSRKAAPARGSAGGVHRVTGASVPVRPPGGGSSGVKARSTADQTHLEATMPLDEWWAKEDAADLARRKAEVGLT